MFVQVFINKEKKNKNLKIINSHFLFQLDPNVLLEELANTSTKTDARKLYIDNVPSQHCNCDWMVLPKLDLDYRNKSKELCPRCECKYESRNLTTIKWVISGTMLVITCLTVYMIFLMAVEYLNGNSSSRRSYDEQINEEVSMDDQSSDAAQRPHSISSLDDVAILPSKNVINRVNQQQSKWKQTIIEQRRNIYDKHTMLN